MGGNEPSGAVSIVVPAYDEADGIAATLEELDGVLRQAGADLEWEIVVVDDGSSDGTAEVLDALASHRLRTFRHRRSRGYGAALKTGIRQARYPWIVIIDADGTYPPQHVPDLLARRHGHDMVVGARVGAERHVPRARLPAKWFLRKLASYLSGVEIVDLNSGLRLFTRDLVERFLRLLPDGFSFTSTLTLAALSSSYSVGYVAIDYRKRRGRSKIRPIRDSLAFLSLIVRTIMFFDPLRVLLPLSLLFGLAAVAVAVGSIVLTGQLMDVTTVVLLVGAVQILTLGIVADSINRWLR